MPAIPTLKPITRRLPASTLHSLDDDINNYLPLQLRDPNPSPRGGGGGGGGHSSSTSHGSSSSSSSSSSDKSHKSGKGSSSSTTIVVVGGGPRYYGPHNNLLLPVWAIILILVLVFETTLFCCALGWFYRQAKAERKLLYPKKPRPQLKYSRIWLNAFIIASWLWIPIAIFNLIMERVIEPRKGIKKERKGFRPLVDTTSSSSKVDGATVSTPYKGAGVGAGAGVDAELSKIKRTNSAYSKIPSGTDVNVEEVKMKYDSPEDVKIPLEKEKKTESAAPSYSGGAFVGYAPAPVPAPVSPIVANEPAETQSQGAAASYFAMSSQPQNQQEQGAAASYFSSYSGTQGQSLPFTNPRGKQ